MSTQGCSGVAGHTRMETIVGSMGKVRPWQDDGGVCRCNGVLELEIVGCQVQRLACTGHGANKGELCGHANGEGRGEVTCRSLGHAWECRKDGQRCKLVPKALVL